MDPSETGPDAMPTHTAPTHRDPMMAAEHEAMMALVTTAEITHRAVRDGAWSDPRTWQDGRVPADGSVVMIGEGRHVAYDVASDASITKLRIDGSLSFATDRDTLLEVDTVVVTGTGRLEVGTAADPIRAGVTARIVFADNGPVAWTSWDPMQLHRGLVAHGPVEMHGEAKTPYLALAEDPRAGATSVTLQEASWV